MFDTARLALSLLLMRVTVFLVMLMWTLDKFVNPDHAAAVYEKFYMLGGFSRVAMFAVGAAELVILLAFVAGFLRGVTYLLVAVFHGVSTLSSFPQYFQPFDNLLFFAAWPMFAACIALWLLRHRDNWLAIDAIRAGRKAS